MSYILIVALIGFPVMLAELSIGRATHKNVVGAFHQLNKKWTFAGGIGVLTLFVIMSYYSVVGGWVLKYVFAYLAEPGFGSGAVSYQCHQYSRKLCGLYHGGVEGVQMLPMNAVMEKFTDNLMIPLGALCFCLFAGWAWGNEKASEEISSGGKYPFRFRGAWEFVVRFVAPALIFLILYFTVGKGQGLS